MNVIWNGLAALKTRTGIGHYTADLADALAQQLSVATYPIGYYASFARKAYATVSGHRKPAIGQSPTPLRRILKGVAPLLRDMGNRVLRHGFESLCRKGRFDVYHEPNFIPFRVDVPTVVTIHDLTVLLHPEWHPRDRVELWEREFRSGLGYAQHLITVSEQTRGDVIRVLGWPTDRVTTVHNGINPRLESPTPAALAEARNALELPDQYLLHVGTLEPRKNVLMLMKAYVSLAVKVRRECPLLLVGGWGWNAEPVARYFDEVARHAGVRHLGYVPHEHLPAVYTLARALVFPTLYEGFGLPVIEMMACGGAVLASDIECLREVGGGHARFIPATDTDGWRDAMEQVINDNDHRNDLRRGVVEHAAMFRYERCAKETITVYQRMLGTGHRMVA